MSFLVATTSLPAVDRPNADRWNAARSCQKKRMVKKEVHYRHCQSMKGDQLQMPTARANSGPLMSSQLTA